MSRFKREIRRKGIKLSNDYPFLPYAIKGKCFESGNICVDDVFVNSSAARVIVVYNVDAVCLELQRDGSIKEIAGDR